MSIDKKYQKLDETQIDRDLKINEILK